METIKHTDICLLSRVALTITLLFVSTNIALAETKDVTAFIMINTAVPQTVDREWKQNCPVLLCGTEDKKGADVRQVLMNKVSNEKIMIQGTVVARASFGVLSPLDDKQIVKVFGAANPTACTFKVDNLTFADGVAQFLVDLFANLKGKVYPFKDKRGKCDQYFPKDL